MGSARRGRRGVRLLGAGALRGRLSARRLPVRLSRRLRAAGASASVGHRTSCEPVRRGARRTPGKRRLQPPSRALDRQRSVRPRTVARALSPRAGLLLWRGSLLKDRQDVELGLVEEARLAPADPSDGPAPRGSAGRPSDHAAVEEDAEVSASPHSPPHDALEGGGACALDAQEQGCTGTRPMERVKDAQHVARRHVCVCVHFRNEPASVASRLANFNEQGLWVTLDPQCLWPTTKPKQKRRKA